MSKKTSRKFPNNPGRFGVAQDIEEMPIPQGVMPELIAGTPIDWHDLENFIIANSPTRVVNLLKLCESRMRAEQERKSGFSLKRRKPFPVWILIVGVVILVAGGVLVMFGPQIMPYLKGMFGGI